MCWINSHFGGAAGLLGVQRGPQKMSSLSWFRGMLYYGLTLVQSIFKSIEVHFTHNTWIFMDFILQEEQL